MSMHEFGEAEFGEFGEAEFGEAEFGEAEFGEYGEAEYGEAEYGEAEYGEAEYGETEYGETEYGEYGEFGETEFGEMRGSPLNQAQEVELATELLEISNEQELEQFLGNLFRAVAWGVGGAIRSPVGKALGVALKGVARKALPMVGGALGSMVAPGIGTALGSKLGSAASGLFEVELGELSNEQAEFEVARKLVNLAASAAQHAALAPRTADPRTVVRIALTKAARVHAPGLARLISRSTTRRISSPCPPCPPRRATGYGRPRDDPSAGGAEEVAFEVPYAPRTASRRAGGRGRADPRTAAPDDLGPDDLGAPSGDGQRGGRWFRRGNKIIVMGA
jgi:uncharacterized protein (DUF697 family)